MFTKFFGENRKSILLHNKHNARIAINAVHQIVDPSNGFNREVKRILAQACAIHELVQRRRIARNKEESMNTVFESKRQTLPALI